MRALYHGQSPAAVRFRLAVISIDLLLIGFFIVTPLLRDTRSFLLINYLIAFVLALDLAAGALAWRSVRAWLRRPRNCPRHAEAANCCPTERSF